MMSTPLQDALHQNPETSEAPTARAMEARVAEVFANAQSETNQFGADRLQELHDVVERALELAFTYDVGAREREAAEKEQRRGRWLEVIGTFGSAGLLATAAPLVAQTSVLLAIGCGAMALFTVVAHQRRTLRRLRDGRDAALTQAAAPALPPPPTASEKFEGLVTAADRALIAMTQAQALPAARQPRTPLGHEDVLALLQDILVLAPEGQVDTPKGSGSDGGTEQTLVDNAKRLVRLAGFDVVWRYEPDIFDIMVDPAIDREILLKPALRHRTDADKNVLGIFVRPAK